MKLLIVDDEYFAVQGILDGVNWDVLGFDEVLTAYTYQEAMEIFQKNYIEILLSDIELPDENGLELVEWVNEHSPNTECILLSCHDEFDYARKAVSLKCMDYVLKPVRYNKLTEILQKAIDVWNEKRHKAMMENYGQQYIDSVAQKSKGDYVDAVEEVANYIDGHLAENLSVRDLANMVYISSDHLTRTFKKRYGKTVSDYILEKRMTLAGELLTRQDLTITMVSDTVGFGNYSYFTEQFKRYYGVTPRDYQKKHRNQPGGGV